MKSYRTGFWSRGGFRRFYYSDPDKTKINFREAFHHKSSGIGVTRQDTEGEVIQRADDISFLERTDGERYFTFSKGIFFA